MRMVPDRYSVRHIEDFSQALQEKMIFSSVDLVKAYYKIPVAKEHIPKTAVTTRLYEFLCMSFGLRNAALIFQRFMDGVLNGLEFCYTYIDDILIVSSSL